MGSGKTISLAGPSIIFVYMIIGFMLFFVMRAMGELLLSNLEYKSFSDFASDLLGPWAGYFTGWTYWFCWVVTGMADVVAITAYAQFWFPDLSDWVASLAVIVLLLTLNLATVKMFGEMEFWFAMIKIVAIVSLIVVGLVMVAMHFQSPTGVEASFAHLWNDGGWFPKGLSGFFAGFQIAVFAFVGIELVGTTAAETKDPEKSLPRAINSIPIRIIMFYVFALIVIMSVTPFIDVMLVLLIIFMVAAPLATVDVKVNLPASTSTPQPRPEKPVYLSVKADNSMFIGNDPVTDETMITALNALTEGKKDTTIFFRADKTVDYETLMKVMDTLHQAGYLKIGLVGEETAKAK